MKERNLKTKPVAVARPSTRRILRPIHIVTLRTTGTTLTGISLPTPKPSKLADVASREKATPSEQPLPSYRGRPTSGGARTFKAIISLL